MGLDSYFKVKNGDKFVDLAPDGRLSDVNLCGGLVSGNGSDGSFRGKVYDGFLKSVTGGDFSLYREEQGIESYGGVPSAIQSWLEENPAAEGNDFGLTLQEICDLKTLFEVASEQHAILIGWW
ncbi:hypothetical protein [Agrobacterium tumefaciens]|uniref:hypothetical protein n=1 Tax=Agrobacterium tumefaciens TaxID=358 RepID=UPI003BA05BA4